MNLKKTITTVALCSLTVLALTACGSKTTTKKGTTTKTNVTTAAKSTTAAKATTKANVTTKAQVKQEVSFEVDGGTSINKQEYKAGETLDLPVAEKEGYEFAGWYKESALTNLFTDKTMPDRDIVLYAKFVKVINIYSSYQTLANDKTDAEYYLKFTKVCKEEKIEIDMSSGSDYDSSDFVQNIKLYKDSLTSEPVLTTKDFEYDEDNGVLVATKTIDEGTYYLYFSTFEDMADEKNNLRLEYAFMHEIDYIGECCYCEYVSPNREVISGPTCKDFTIKANENNYIIIDNELLTSSYLNIGFNVSDAYGFDLDKNNITLDIKSGNNPLVRTNLGNVVKNGPISMNGIKKIGTVVVILNGCDKDATIKLSISVTNAADEPK